MCVHFCLIAYWPRQERVRYRKCNEYIPRNVHKPPLIQLCGELKSLDGYIVCCQSGLPYTYIQEDMPYTLTLYTLYTHLVLTHRIYRVVLYCIVLYRLYSIVCASIKRYNTKHNFFYRKYLYTLATHLYVYTHYNRTQTFKDVCVVVVVPIEIFVSFIQARTDLTSFI